MTYHALAQVVKHGTPALKHHVARDAVRLQQPHALGAAVQQRPVDHRLVHVLVGPLKVGQPPGYAISRYGVRQEHVVGQARAVHADEHGNFGHALHLLQRCEPLQHNRLHRPLQARVCQLVLHHAQDLVLVEDAARLAVDDGDAVEGARGDARRVVVVRQGEAHDVADKRVCKVAELGRDVRVQLVPVLGGAQKGGAEAGGVAVGVGYGLLCDHVCVGVLRQNRHALGQGRHQWHNGERRE
eukprot:CAMPEP_0177679582 /NCGR_PEP_ID=MMETSP0447-20121125/29683_1 /TAXON_ID=0 /ORGANISM="Stygamoeba regulata, Strain BSH-02190019" /LENGTH=240 /DNA_ID=CAMNT_0019188789 /DNA_START=138 /DNA_END=862 /DNA_ORIENTATION=+